MTTVLFPTSREILNGEELLARCMGNGNFAMRVVDKFCARLEQDLAELDQAERAGDRDQVALLAHRIKGASASVSAAQLQARAAELERAARGACTADLSTGVERLRQAWRRFAQEVPLLELDICKAR